MGMAELRKMSDLALQEMVEGLGAQMERIAWHEAYQADADKRQVHAAWKASLLMSRIIEAEIGRRKGRGTRAAKIWQHIRRWSL